MQQTGHALALVPGDLFCVTDLSTVAVGLV
jgi:hypothetical protein